MADARRRARGLRASRRRPAGARRPQLVGGRGHGDVVDGRSVRVGHRDQRLRRVRRRGDGGAGLAEAGRRRRASDRGARPAADRAGVRRRDVRHRSGDRSHRPPGRQRRPRRARAAGERRGRRLPLRARPVERARFSSSRPTTARRSESADLRRLVELSAKVASVFGGPQDVEWAIDDDKQLWLLQSRPVTTEIRGVPRGPIYGPGPVAETFPSPAHRARARSLGSPAARSGARSGGAGRLGHRGATSPASEVVVCVDGHVAIDLRLAGEIKPKLTLLSTPEPDPRRPPPAGRVEGRAAPVGAAPPGRAPPRPHGRRSRGGSGAAELDEPAADRAAAPQPGHPAGAPRPRDPHRHAHRHRRQPDDGRLGGAAGAGRGAPGRPRRQGDPRSEPGRPRAHRAAGGPGARCCPKRR